MPQELSILTPEKVELTFRLAGLPSRICAFIVDILIILVVQSLILLLISTLSGAARLGAEAQTIWGSLFLYIFLVGFLAYPFLFTVFMHGQTPAKMLMGMRVVMANGGPVTTQAAALRTMLLLVDILPSVSLVGALAMFFSERAQRVGDMVAGTIVITTKMPLRPGSERGADIQTHPLEAYVGSVSALNENDLRALRGFLDRYPELAPEARDRLYREIWTSIVSRVQFETPPGASPLTMLMAVASKLERDLATRL